MRDPETTLTSWRALVESCSVRRRGICVIHRRNESELGQGQTRFQDVKHVENEQKDLDLEILARKVCENVGQQGVMQ